MTRHDISAATFIKDNISGAFCLFESMACYLHLVEDMTIIDLGSTDGTLRILQDIAATNPRIRVIQSHFSKVDAGAFADVANDCVASWQRDSGLFWQADEIPHEDMLTLLDQKLSEGVRDLAFWRYQLKENFQLMKWPPHPVHRLGTRTNGKFHFVDDGMNSDRQWEPGICSDWDMGWFIRWGEEFKDDFTKLPTHEMVMDVSANGGFLDNIVQKRIFHAPMWHERPNVDQIPVKKWIVDQRNNPNWHHTSTPFNIPHIMKWHVGRTTYAVRASLVTALKYNTTEELLHA